MKQFKFKIICIIFYILILIFIIIGFSMSYTTNKQCKNICLNKGTDVYLRINNGEFNLKDSCVCIFDESCKLVRL